MKVMISQPMRGKTEEQIKEEREKIINQFEKMHIEVVDTLFKEKAQKERNKGIFYLGKSINAMKDIDALYMCEGWREARGCRIEHEVAKNYNIKILYSDFLTNSEIGTRTI